MRGGQGESMSSVLARRGIRPNITVDTMPGQPEEAPIPQPSKGFAEELFSNGTIPHEMKLKLMQLYDKGGDAQSFNEGLYSEDYRGMDHDFKGKLSGLYGERMPNPAVKKGKGKKGRMGMIGKPMPATSVAPDSDDKGPDTDGDMEIGESKPPMTSGRKPQMGGGPVMGGSGPIMANKNTMDSGMRPISEGARPAPNRQFDPNKLAMLMQYMNGGGH